MEALIIKSQNVVPGAAEVNHDNLINLWSQTEKYFENTPIIIDNGIEININIDAKEIKQRLDDLKDENCEKYLKQFFKNHEKWEDDKYFEEHPFGGRLVINISEKIFNNPNEKFNFVTRFLEQLFLAMNLSSRGGCNLSAISYLDKKNIYKEEKYSLHCDVIENAWHRSNIDGWPLLKGLEFSLVWEWLTSQGALNFMLADSPTKKALAMLLHCSYKYYIVLIKLK